MKKEIEGFIANRLLRALGREATYLVDEGYASFEEVDLAAEKALGHPLGPFRLMDLTGIDLAYMIRSAIYEASGRAEDRPPRCIAERYRAGHYGRKTGRGFYRYESARLSGSARDSEDSRPAACPPPSPQDARACPRERRPRGCAARARG